VVELNGADRVLGKDLVLALWVAVGDGCAVAEFFNWLACAAAKPESEIAKRATDAVATNLLVRFTLTPIQ